MTIRFLVVLTLVAWSAGCERNWKLEITEVDQSNIEIFLDHASDEALSLRGMTVSWQSKGGQPRSIDLGLVPDALPGGEFLVIWEYGPYMGPPVAERYSGGAAGRVPGIKVAAGYLAGLETSPSVVSLSGSRTDGLIVVHRVRDEVKFGLPVADRPQGLDAFTSDGTLTNPGGSISVQRLWRTGHPVDTGAESDWLERIANLGVPTP